MDDGRLVGAACSNRPEFRAFVRSWADAAIDTGADRIFWDKPHWVNPSSFGLSRMPGLDTLATDPYRKAFGQPARDFVGGFARLVSDLGEEHGVNGQIWIQGFGLGPEDADNVRAAVEAARGAGVGDLWTWGYEACGHMSHLGTREPENVWAVLTEALTGHTAAGR